MPHSPDILKSTGTKPIDACWSRIGVWGDLHCPELPKVVHCRNCPTYSAAAVSMLDRELCQGHLEEWTRHFSQPKTDLSENLTPFVLYRVSSEWFALPVAAVIEIVDQRPVRSLPHPRNPCVQGLVAVRGQLLICISLVRLLELDNEHTLPGTRETNFARLLVVSSPEGPVVFPVSEVASISRYRDTDLRPVPATLPSAGKRFTKAVLPWQTKCRSGKNVTTEEVSASLLDEQGLCEHINRSLS